jgi:hypothetical protein
MSEELQAIEILEGNADWTAKQTACRTLRLKGTVKSVPVLARLLNDAQMSQFARYALEPMPYEAAGQALVAALATTSGSVKVGIINSLGVRTEAGAVAELEAALTDADPAVVGAAAVALARIGTRESTRPVIRLVRGGLPAGTGADVADALLTIAASAAERGGRAEMTRRLLETLQGAAWPKHIREAATAGLQRL